MKFKSLIAFLLIAAASPVAFGQLSGTNPLVRFNTDVGNIDVLMLQDVAPNNVANFLAYVQFAIYDNSFVHRSIPTFVIQGGGYKFANGQRMALIQGAPVVNEFHVSNRRGTLAMAKLPNDPNSATNQWFFNLSDANAGTPPNGLDYQNGGFTVFGRIIDSAGLATIDAIAALRRIDWDGSGGNIFDDVPVINYHAGDTVNNSKLVNIIWIKVVPQIVSVTQLSPTTLRIEGRGQPNTSYRLDMSASPASTTFTTLSNVTTTSGGTFTFDDTNAGARKFYRLAIP